MSIQRFVAANSRDAMRQVRAALGDDALILANRQVEEGFEILAVAEGAVPPAGAVVARSPPAAPPDSPFDFPFENDSGAAELRLISERLLREMHDMRQLLAGRQSGPAGDCRAALRRQLLATGFGAALAGELPGSLPAELAAGDPDAEPVQAWLRRRLAARLRVADDLSDLSGAVALVGSTGVGKTTTTAKLAARAVMARGPGQVALISTDSFRIGAHEQLRIYGGLMGVPVHALAADQSLATLLFNVAGTGDAPLVLIDTMGMSQRDQGVIQQVGRLSKAGVPLRLVLLLNAAGQPEAIEEVIGNYRQAARAAGVSLDDCLLTKLDEAGRLGPVLGAVMGHGLRVLAVTEGQRVPEDLAPVDAQALVARALSCADDAAVAAPPPPAGWIQGLLGHGRRLAGALDTLRTGVAGYTLLEQVWDLAGLPEAAREARLTDLLASAPAAATVLWARRGAVAGGDWAMADLALDAGGWQALPALQHRQLAGERERLAAATGERGVGAHLLPRLPDRDALAWLTGGDIAWCCPAAGVRVGHRGERQPLSALVDLALEAGDHRCRWRGREARLRLFSLPVAISPAGRRGADVTAVDGIAWFGDVLAAADRRVLARRCWLTPPLAAPAAANLILAQVQGEAILSLARRGRQRLGGTLPGLANTELRTLLACGLAAVAVRLDESPEEWAMDLRADLVSLSGGRRDGAAALVDALIYLMLGREALGLGAAGGEGRH